jgi:hypothetical protein
MLACRFASRPVFLGHFSLENFHTLGFLHRLRLAVRPQCSSRRRIAYEIDPALHRHEVDDGSVLRRERLDVSSAALIRFSERVLCARG